MKLRKYSILIKREGLHHRMEVHASKRNLLWRWMKKKKKNFKGKCGFRIHLLVRSLASLPSSPWSVNFYCGKQPVMVNAIHGPPMATGFIAQVSASCSS